MNDNNNFPRNSKSNNKLPEGWGNSKNGDAKASPWENKPKTTAWENSPQASPWGNTNNNSENRPSKPQGINTENVNAAINKFAGMAKRAGEKAVSAAADAAKNAADYAKSDEAAEKMNAVKNKAQALASGAGSKLSDIKNKASDKISERKNKAKSSDENISAADEHDTAENYDVSSGETVYQKDEENAYEADKSIAADDTSFKDDTNENSSPAPVREKEAQNHSIPPFTPQNMNNQQTQRPVSQFQRPVPQPQSPVPPQSSTPGYVVQTQKTSPVLIIVIIVLVLIVVILGGMFFMKSRYKWSDEADKSSTVSGVGEVTTESEMQTTTAEKPTETETTTETTEKDSKTLTTYPESEISKYPQYINAAENDRGSGLADYFALVDINADDIPELFLTDTNGMIYAIYTAVGNDYAELQRVGGTGRDWITLYNDGCISHGSSFGNNGGYTDYEYIGGNEFKEIKSYSLDEYSDIPASHGGEASISVSSLANYISKNKIPSAYKGYENIENAPTDMEFYDINKTATGYVKTESTGLNMRTGAGTNYNIVTEVPKGAEVEIFGENSEWYYVKYIMNIKPTPKAYFGFISKQYISFTPINISVEVYSCNYLGQINAPSGEPINGYATSYIVDRGAVSYTRTDLMDNWHVTAVRYCVVNGITWYELYDTDDGDYYGWLDKDHIDFY